VRLIREYLKLIRPYGILFLGFAPVFGAVCNGQDDVFSLALLLLIGVLGHIFVFVQNDYYDVEVDRQSKYVVQRPLTSGTLPRAHARLLFICSFFLSVVFTGVFFFSLRCFLTLLLSFFLMTLYNRYCKKFPGMEYVLGAAVFTYGIFGAFTVSDQVSVFALIISCIGFLQWVFSVGISANLKDVEFDTKLGIRTTPVRFGVHVVNHELKKPMSFVLYTYGIKLLHLIVALLPFLFGFSSPLLFGYPFPLFGFLLLAGFLLFTTQVILTTPLDKRDQMLRYEGAHEGLALLLIACVLASYLVEHLGNLFVFFLFVLFIAWPLFCLRFLYGKSLIPLE